MRELGVTMDEQNAAGGAAEQQPRKRYENYIELLKPRQNRARFLSSAIHDNPLAVERRLGQNTRTRDTSVKVTTMAASAPYRSITSLAARQRADELLAEGDLDGQHVWKLIGNAVRELQRTRLTANERQH